MRVFVACLVLLFLATLFSTTSAADVLKKKKLTDAELRELEHKWLDEEEEDPDDEVWSTYKHFPKG